LSSIPGAVVAHMDSKNARRLGRVPCIMSMKAPTAPTITKLFQRQPDEALLDIVEFDLLMNIREDDS
jgi:hypothetical protein